MACSCLAGLEPMFLDGGCSICGAAAIAGRQRYSGAANK